MPDPRDRSVNDSPRERYQTTCAARFEGRPSGSLTWLTFTVSVSPTRAVPPIEMVPVADRAALIGGVFFALRPAEGLKALYEAELRFEAGNLGLGLEERQGLSQLLSASRRMRAGELREQDHAGVWLWSDLHLGHAMALSFFGRPYWTPEEMDDALFGAWRQGVDPGDTVVILGDVAIGGLSGRRLKRLRAAPGRKVLVVGNHEFDGTVGGHLDGFDEVFSTVYVPGSPGLLVTHVPLRDVPEGYVNVHGYQHMRAPSAPSGTRHINVVVEQVSTTIEN